MGIHGQFRSSVFRWQTAEIDVTNSVLLGIVWTLREAGGVGVGAVGAAQRGISGSFGSFRHTLKNR